jgi:hypothetical protein
VELHRRPSRPAVVPGNGAELRSVVTPCPLDRFGWFGDVDAWDRREGGARRATRTISATATGASGEMWSCLVVQPSVIETESARERAWLAPASTNQLRHTFLIRLRECRRAGRLRRHCIPQRFDLRSARRCAGGVLNCRDDALAATRADLSPGSPARVAVRRRRSDSSAPCNRQRCTNDDRRSRDSAWRRPQG